MTLLTVYFASPEAYAEANAQQNVSRAQQNGAHTQQVSTASPVSRNSQASSNSHLPSAASPILRNTQQAANRSAYEFQHQTLTQMVELPELPQYSGQMSFVTGTYFPNAKSGASYTLKMRSIECQEAVRDWYKAALQQSGWKLEQAMCNEHTVAAWKGKLLVQVIVDKPSHARFRSDVLLRYRSGS